MREADRRYSVLTPTHGKMVFMGRGAQKGKAKLAAHLEPFAVVDLEIIKGRRSTTVISVERQEAFRHISRDLECRLLAQASLHLLDRYTREADEDPELYHILYSWLTFLNKEHALKPARSTFLLGGFLLRLLQHLGYETQLATCLHCKEDIVPLAFRWHGGRGGLVCSDCVQKDREEWFAARPMQEETVKWLRFARNAEYKDLLAPALSGAMVEEFAQVVHDLISFHLPGDYEVPFWTGILADYPLAAPVNPV